MRDGGSIIMNGSIAHLKGMPGLSVCAGSKAALRSFARSWAVELAERRIRVNMLSPGPIATSALASLPAEAKEHFLSEFLVRNWDTLKRSRRRLYFSLPTTLPS